MFADMDISTFTPLSLCKQRSHNRNFSISIIESFLEGDVSANTAFVNKKLYDHWFISKCSVAAAKKSPRASNHCCYFYWSFRIIGFVHFYENGVWLKSMLEFWVHSMLLKYFLLLFIMNEKDKNCNINVMWFALYHNSTDALCFFYVNL